MTNLTCAAEQIVLSMMMTCGFPAAVVSGYVITAIRQNPEA
jgi:hypothetical protein